MDKTAELTIQTKVEGLRPSQVYAVYPWERYLTSISSVHPAVFKMGTQLQAVEGSCQSVECIRPMGSSTFLCFPGS